MKLTTELRNLGQTHLQHKGLVEKAADKIESLEREVEYWVSVSQDYEATLKGIHNSSFIEPMIRVTKQDDGSYYTQEL